MRESVVALLRPRPTSAVWSLSGVKRTKLRRVKSTFMALSGRRIAAQNVGLRGENGSY